MAPVVVGLLTECFTPVNVLGLLGNTTSAIRSLLGTVVFLPFWALVLMSFIWPILHTVARCLPSTEEEEDLPPEMEFLTYTSDSFFGVKWLWPYAGNRIDADKITARCPECECLLDWVKESGFQVIDDITLICPHCGFRKHFKRNEEGITRLVQQQIDRKIVTGEFRKYAQ